MKDQELVRLQRARAFDQTALATIYDDYHQPIYRYIYRQVSDVETARDLTSEVFHRLLKSLQKGEGPDHGAVRKVPDYTYAVFLLIICIPGPTIPGI